MMKAKIQKFIFYIIFASIIFVFILILQIPYFRSVNNLFLDQLQGQISARSEIVILKIDDLSLQKIGAWPWDRTVFAKAIQNLSEAKPRVVAIDVLFLEKREGDNALQNALTQAKFTTVLASKYVDNVVLKNEYNNVLSGFVNFEQDSDAKIRHTILEKTINDDVEKSFSYNVFLAYLGSLENNIQNERNFSYTKQEFTSYSFVNLYENKINKELLKDKIILLGSTSTDLKSNLNDNFTDVFGRTIPGIEIHANIINSFLQNKFLSTVNFLLLTPVFILLSLFLLYIFHFIKKNWKDGAILFGALLLANIFGIILYDFNILFDFITINAIIILAYIYALAYKYLIESKKSAFIGKAFAQYINPKLLSRLMQNPNDLKLGGEKKNMTVMFSDVRGFTTLSEKILPEELISILNAYLDVMCNIVIDNNGTIDKFIGDAIMAFWNAPLDDSCHATNAITTSLSMIASLKQFNTNHTDFEDLHIGIGINTGEMIVGNIGSNERFDYTVIGDNVNLGSRIEGLTKKYGVDIIITESTLVQFETENIFHDQIIFRHLDTVVVKGKNIPIKIYEPLQNTPENFALKNAYEKALYKYMQGDFNEAKILFDKMQDKTSSIMIERLNDRPTEWNGIWHWTEK